MIFDKLKDVPNSNKVIIIGSGPAGLSAALYLEKKGISSIVFEAGKLNPDENSQKLYNGKVIGDNYPDLSVSRLRQFGGTSGHWGGNCVELDDYDFDNWPITKKDLNDFKEDSYNILDIKGNFYKKKFNDDLEIFNLNWSSVRFKEKYFEKIKKSKKISLVLNCPLIQFNGKDGKVDSASFFQNEIKNVNGKIFILATGGVENSRLLLWSREKNPTLINKNLPIGNYWMDHPYHSVAEGVLFKKNFENYLNKNNLKKYFDTSCNYSFLFSPNKTMIENLDLFNSSINIGIQNLSNEIKKNTFIKQVKCLAPSMFRKFLSGEEKVNNYTFSISLLTGQNSSFQNRIELSKEKDYYGIPYPTLYWKRSEKVRQSSKKIVENIANFLVSENLGRLAADEFLYNNKEYAHLNGYHHMGGTRMGNDKEYSVVDKNLKVHDTENLFVSGSSVFTTAGHAYPTLTITQLSLRLANHISKLTF